LLQICFGLVVEPFSGGLMRLALRLWLKALFWRVVQNAPLASRLNKDRIGATGSSMGS